MSDDNSRQKILNSALESFSQKGYEGCGVSEIAEKAGVTKPSLYYFFSSKEGLYKAVWQENLDPFLYDLEKQAKYDANPNEYYKDVYPCLSKVVKLFFDYAQKNKSFFFHAISSFSAPDTVSTAEIYKSYYCRLYDILRLMFMEMGKAHGGISGRDLQLAVTFLGLITSYITCWNIRGDELNDNTVDSLVRQFMHGIF